MRSESDDVSIRLTANQVSLIWSGLNEVVKSHATWRSNKEPAFSYPFRLFPPPPEFDGGAFSSQFMELVIGDWKRLRSKMNCGGRFRMNTMEIRAAILGARVNMDWSRFRQKAGRKYSNRAKGSKEPDDTSLKRLRGQTDCVIRSLERHMKRANYRFRMRISGAAYEEFMEQWRAHVRWMRLHFAYFKLRPSGIHGMKTAYQQVLNDLTVIAIAGIQREGYKLPDPVQLRRIMRLYVAYTRRGRLPYPIRYMLKNEKAIGVQYILCRFVEQRLSLVETEQ